MAGMKKGARQVLAVLLLVAGGLLTAKSLQVIRKENFQWGKLLLGNACNQTGTRAVTGFLPYLEYEEDRQEQDVWEVVMRELKAQIPFLDYADSIRRPEGFMEDENTCHALIEANEQQLMEKILGENQADAVTEENQKATEDDQKVSDDEKSKEPQNKTDAEPVSVQPHPEIDISREKLSDYNYLLNTFFVVDPNTTTNADQLNAAALMDKDMKMKSESGQPQILIYHTHSQEGYADSTEGDMSTGVVGVGDYLTELLEEQYGYQVIHMKNTFDLVDGRLDRNKAYNQAQGPVEQMLEENPSIEVVIDLHRDGVPEDKHLVTEINGKQTAKVMFFNGLSKTAMNGDIDYLPNPNKADNLAFSFQLAYQSKLYYPRFTRCIYLKGYRYNLHVRPKALLLEVGAQTNTFEEAKNAMEPFADILNKVLKGT